MYTRPSDYRQDFKNKNYYEDNQEPSMTQPDMVLSLQQLIENHTRGIPIPTINPNYSEFTDSIPEFGKLSKLEQSQVIKDVKDSNLRYEQLIIKQRKEAEKDLETQKNKDLETISSKNIPLKDGTSSQPEA